MRKNKNNNKNKNIDKTKITRINVNLFNKYFQSYIVVWITI